MKEIKYMTVKEIRSGFLEFFKSKQHYIHESFPLVPINDNSLLLINSGMAPLKNYFLGKEHPPAPRMATCQKCIRTGDIENVGVTARHATFFEMLGNFSFGDYFKKEAIAWAWEYITQVLDIDEELLWVTVYEEDDEAFEIWRNEIGVREERIVRLGKEDNFWEIGNGSGPCGPCSEIYLDRGPSYSCEGPAQPGSEGDRFLEFWNLVFTQFDKSEDGTLQLLPNPNIDTGMGLERMACIMQGVDSIFDIDTMQSIIGQIATKAGKTYGSDKKHDTSMRVIADHTKAVTFLICDGVQPSNEGRGYVLRRLLRRAARHGKLLGIEGEFLKSISDTVMEEYGDAYPDLLKRKDYIQKILMIEEKKFAETIDQGMNRLYEMIERNKEENRSVLSGEDSFKLYDTFGFPLELTEEILEENGMKNDNEGFADYMEKQRSKSRAAREDMDVEGWSGDEVNELVKTMESSFDGYDHLEMSSTVMAIVSNNELVDSIGAGEPVQLILDSTPFYAQGGGQVGDVGELIGANCVASVLNTTKSVSGVTLHHVVVERGYLEKGEMLTAKVNLVKRRATQRNHTATHVLQAALKEVLGDHVMQAGSLVDSEKLRFDFNHFAALTAEELQEVEALVNRVIFEIRPVSYRYLPIAEAKAQGATAYFDEKYGETVRVLTIDGFSVELCGGTHVSNTSEIGMFKILSEGGIASGIRRIEAITGSEVYRYLLGRNEIIDEVKQRFKSHEDQLLHKIDQNIAQTKELQSELADWKRKQGASVLEELIKDKKAFSDLFYVQGVIADADTESLRDQAQMIIDKDPSSVVALATAQSGKALFVVMMGKNALDHGLHAGNLIKEIAKVAQGGGGGKPNFASAGGKDASKIEEALQKGFEVLTQ